MSPSPRQLEEARPLCLEPSCGRRLDYNVVHNCWLCSVPEHPALTGRDAAKIRAALEAASRQYVSV